jgi:hypothetical protein
VRVLRSLSVLAVLVPGLLAVPVLTPAASAAPVPVPPVVQELDVAGVDETAAEQSAPSGVAGALVLGAGRRTVLLTDCSTRGRSRSSGSPGTTARRRRGPGMGAHPPPTAPGPAGRRSWGSPTSSPDRVSPDTGASSAAAPSPLWVGSADGVQAASTS